MKFIDTVIMRYTQIFEFIKYNGFSALFREYVFLNRRAVIVMKNLDDIEDKSEHLNKLHIDILELTPEILLNDKYHFEFKNRYLKALDYIKKGYKGHAIAKGNTIIGDTWYFASCESLNGSCHQDIHRLGISLPEDAVYAFDIFVAPSARGDNVSSLFQNNAMFLLNKKGYKKAFSFIWADNVAARWNAKIINKWKESSTVKISRFLMWSIAGKPQDKGQVKTDTLSSPVQARRS